MTDPTPDSKSVFGRAAEIPSPVERAAFLDAACAGHPAVRAEVETLLKALGEAGSFMRHPAAPAGETVPYDPPLIEGEGTVIGPYTLREQIGEGGMGLVFVAEQQQPVRRKVALKVIKPGMDTRQVVARFEAERQALALMDHPNIAKVLDAGTTASGLPYFVMELVRGVPITEYADANSLTPRDRLGLFVQVCQAVQHAHQKGVIHRDLKPSNILVAPHDGVPVVKVIDFGVAKALGQSLTEKTIYTRLAQMIGTPLYMSPEQAEVNQLDVDTRSDVYALGVLLYELLTGTTPFDGDRFRKAAFDEIRRILKEEEPPKPSTRLTSLGATLTAVSAKRGTDPGRLSGLVRGELDWIVMRCLEKDRTRRYDTAAALAKDVQRHLAGDAVEACPPTLGYRLRRAYRKNRAGVLAAAAFATVLLAATGVSLAFGVAAMGAEAEAERRRQESDDNASRADRSARAARENEELTRQEAAKLRAEQERTRRLLYESHMGSASAALTDNRIPRLLQMLDAATPRPGEPDLRGWEWHYLDRLTRTGHEYTLETGRNDGNPDRVRPSPPVVTGRRLVTRRQLDDGVVFDVIDAATGHRVAQVPKSGVVPESEKQPDVTLFPTLSEDGRYLLVRGKVDAPKRARIWEVESGREVDGPAEPLPRPLGAPRVGADAAWVAWIERPAGATTPGVGGLTTGPVEVTVRRWERGAGMSPPKTLSVGSGVGLASLGPDGHTVFWQPLPAGNGTSARTVECWDTRGETKSRMKVTLAGDQVNRLGRPEVVVSPGQTMVGVIGRGDAVIYRAADGQVHWKIPLPGDDAASVQLSDDGNRLVLCGAGTITVLTKSPSARPDVWHIRYRPVWDAGDPSREGWFRLLDDGRTLINVNGRGTTVRVWDVSRDPAEGVAPKSPPGLRDWTGPDGRVWNERTSADGRVTVRYRKWGTKDTAPPPDRVPPVLVTTRDAEGKESERFELPGGSHPLRGPSVAFVDRERRLLVRTFQATDEPAQGRLTEWKGLEWAMFDLEVPGRLPRLAGGTGHPEAVPNSPYLLNHPPRQYAWTTDTFEILDARTGQLVKGYTASPPARDYVATRMFDSTGDRLIRLAITLPADDDRTGNGPAGVGVEVLATAGGERLCSFDLGQVQPRDSVRASFSPDGRRVLVRYTTTKGTFLRVVSAADGSDSRVIELAAAGSRTNPGEPQVSPDGRHVLVCSADAIDVWDVGTGAKVHHISGHEGGRVTAAFSGDGTRVFSTTLNGSSVTGLRRLHVWDMATGRELLTLPAGFHPELRPGTGAGSVQFEAGRVYLTSPDQVFDGRPMK